jgi:hypothetical protein
VSLVIAVFPKIKQDSSPQIPFPHVSVKNPFTLPRFIFKPQSLYLVWQSFPRFWDKSVGPSGSFKTQIVTASCEQICNKVGWPTTAVTTDEAMTNQPMPRECNGSDFRKLERSRVFDVLGMSDQATAFVKWRVPIFYTMLDL